jgi:hypothetical protein
MCTTPERPRLAVDVRVVRIEIAGIDAGAVRSKTPFNPLFLSGLGEYAGVMSVVSRQELVIEQRTCG